MQWDLLIQAIITGGVAVIVAWLGVLPKLRTIQQQAERTEYAITNQHPTHLRHDLDDNFSNLGRKIDLVLEKQAQTDRHLQGVDDRLERHLVDSTRVRRDIQGQFSIISRKLGCEDNG